MQLRWIEDDGRVTVFRKPSNNSNGNTFDYQGRQLSCEHLMRRVVRYEHDGSATVIADSLGGKRLNSPNDVVAHRTSYCLPTLLMAYRCTRGNPTPPRPSNVTVDSIRTWAAPVSDLPSRAPHGVYRWDPIGEGDLVASEEQVRIQRARVSPIRAANVASTARVADTGPSAGRVCVRGRQQPV